MPRLMGVDIPNDKQIQYSLTYLYGIGLHTAREVCEKLGIDPTRPASDIHEDELGRIAALLERDYTCRRPAASASHSKHQPTSRDQMLSRHASSRQGCRFAVNEPRPTPELAKAPEDGCRQERRQGSSLVRCQSPIS